MTKIKIHSVAIDVEHCRIGCSDCNEWEDFFPREGFSAYAEFIYAGWLERHLKRLEIEE